MAVCEWCGKEFEPEFDSDTFEIEEGILSYRNIRKCLCAECAIRAIDEQVEDVYFETCERCHRVFDYIADSGRFASLVDGVHLIGMWDRDILCCDCAAEEAEHWPTIG